jgi:hypothetical protein
VVSPNSTATSGTSSSEPRRRLRRSGYSSRVSPSRRSRPT